jgi:succinate dehydrogenase / fumarate reductase, membrane anchor subunit
MASITLPEKATAVASPKSGENVWLWLWKLVTGPFIFIIIIIHFVVNHYIGQTGLLQFKEIMSYYRNSIIPVMEGFFLVLVVSHSLLGVRSIILDMKPSRTILNIVNWLFLVVGIFAVVYGIWLLNVIVNQIPAM